MLLFLWRRKFEERSKREGAGFVINVVDLMARAEQLGAKEQPRRKKCDVRFSFARRNPRRSEKERHEAWSEEAVEDGFWSLREFVEDQSLALRMQKLRRADGQQERTRKSPLSLSLSLHEGKYF